MDIAKIASLLKSLEDRALTPQEGVELLEIIVSVLDGIRPNLKRFWLRIILDGVKVSLSELKEHLAESYSDEP